MSETPNFIITGWFLEAICQIIKLHALVARSHRAALAPEISPITICDRLHKATETLKN
ncbi:hypothetical protein QUA82_01365 [Microcoleus sp. F8-D3]